ncbi:flagellar hook-length control protein FliK [Sphingomonas psychrotolerans]|uniref:Flagellar hook-length control protein FliK n=1 Tax=Sphingomonas psychrotolerans TaxID=1327635 RepID=A0ABU3N8R8_9SPHN|nr:flagellar hook-length control protein FliK [Sphingomonas psychrotolerans]MDT8760661.1 flagellar hook-length control protein FliK [Sphingomonas psychrotolerans]
MIQFSLLLPASPQAPVRPTLLASQGASSFALALGALASPARVAVADDAIALPGDSEGEILLPSRQMPAEGGKDLPAPVTDGDEEAENEANDGAGIAFAWFAVAPSPVAAPVGTRARPEALNPEGGTSRDSAPVPSLQRSGDSVAIAPPVDTGVTPAVPEAIPAKPPLLPSSESVEPAGRLEVPIDQLGRGAPKTSATARPDRQIGAGPRPTVPAATAVRSAPFPADKSIVQPVEAPARPVEPIIPPAPVPSSKASATLGQRVSDQTRAAPAPAVVPMVVALPAGPSGSPLAAPIVEAVAIAPPPLRRTADLKPLAAALQLPAGEAAQPNAVSAPAPLPAIVPLPGDSSGDPQAALIAEAVSIAPAPLRRAADREPLAAAVQLPTGGAVQPQPVSAPAGAQQGALDTRRQEWVGKMVEHIEALRDAAPVRETRLSLAPEALGKVEIAIRHEGERVHVHFATETPAARQLIADAQPRLAELAEARGLKLGQTSFESGTMGQGSNRDSRDNPAPQQSLRPRPANPESAGAAADDRIA